MSSSQKNNPQLKALNEAVNEHGAEGIEILSAQPSKLVRSMILLIAALIVAGLLWSFIGHADVIVSAQGRLAPDSDVQRFYTPIDGELVDIYVAEGQPVTKGDTLARRRNKKRIYAELDVSIYVDDEIHSTKMRNISGNGMQIVEPLDTTLEPQQDCQILIQEENTRVRIEALVVWNDFGYIGLCFKKQTQRVQKQLNKLSDKLLVTTVNDMSMANLV